MFTARLARYCALLIVASWSPLHAEETPLVWKFRPADEHHFQLVQKMEMRMTLGAGERQMETALEQSLDMTWKILAVDDDGRATIEQSVPRVVMDMQAPGQPSLHYDTDSDEPPTGYAAMVTPLLKGLTAEPFQMTITERGEIVDLELPPGLAKAMQSTPGAPMMGEMFSDEGFQHMIQQSSLILPKAADLNIDFEWTATSEVKNAQFGRLVIDTTYGYLGSREVEGRPLEAFRYSMKMNFQEAPDGVEIEIVDQQSSGEILFSREAGRLASSKLRQELQMNITAAGQAMTQQMVQTTSLQYVEVEDKRASE